MNLLDRYVAEVGKHLPRRNRADIEAEIRSTLEDMLDERAHGAPASETQISDLLKEYGDPRKVAASYGARQYLIGPRLYPTFELVLKIVFSVLGVLALVGFGLSIGRTGLSGPEMAAALLQAAGQFFGGLLTALGQIVLIFAILERTLPASEMEKDEKEWTPADLVTEPDPDEVKIPEQIASIIFPLFFVVILNFYPQIVGFNFVQHGQWFSVPMLSQAFFRYLPWVNALSLLGVALNIWLLRQGHWQTSTRLFNLALRLGSVILAVFMLSGPSILEVAVGSLPADLEKLTPLFGLISIGTLLAVILGEGIDVIKLVRRLLAHRPAAPYPVSK